MIQEVIEFAELALNGDLEDVLEAAEQLESLEEEHDLNKKLDFNNHMLFNRVVQVISLKLELEQEWQTHHADPDSESRQTCKQQREMSS